MRRLFQAAVFTLMLFPSLGVAQDFDVGLQAYEAGDYARALAEWQNLSDGTLKLNKTEQVRRMSQAEASAKVVQTNMPADPEYGALVERLREAVAQNPDDIQGLTLLARNEAALGNLTASASALNKITVVKGENATAADFAALADTYILATGGYVSPEAEESLKKTLALDPQNGTARFYMGLMWAQEGRPDLAFPFWSELMQEGPENAPWIAPIRARISILATAAAKWHLSQVRSQIDEQRALGAKYAEGDGVLKDKVSAHLWYNIAASKGDEISANNRDRLELNMTPADISEAQRRAKVCMASDYQECD